MIGELSKLEKKCLEEFKERRCEAFENEKRDLTSLRDRVDSIGKFGTSLSELRRAYQQVSLDLDKELNELRRLVLGNKSVFFRKLNDLNLNEFGVLVIFEHEHFDQYELDYLKRKK